MRAKSSKDYNRRIELSEIESLAVRELLEEMEILIQYTAPQNEPILEKAVTLDSVVVPHIVAVLNADHDLQQARLNKPRVPMKKCQIRRSIGFNAPMMFSLPIEFEGLLNECHEYALENGFVWITNNKNIMGGYYHIYRPPGVELKYPSSILYLT